MRAAVLAGSAHWRETALRLLQMHGSDPAAAEVAIAAWLEDPAALAL